MKAYIFSLPRVSDILSGEAPMPELADFAERIHLTGHVVSHVRQNPQDRERARDFLQENLGEMYVALFEDEVREKRDQRGAEKVEIIIGEPRLGAPDISSKKMSR